VAETPSLIAIVDDESSVCRALERLLQSAGFDVVTFTQGAAFIETLKDREPDCLVLDLHMSPMSGFELQSRLGQMTRGVPIVIISGHDSPESRQRVMDAGAVAYLRKPVDDQMLIDTVVAAIAKAKP
jgi:FixJ family two-component response regulator